MYSRNRNSLDFSGAGTPLKASAATPSGGSYYGGPFPNGSKRRSSLSKQPTTTAANGSGRGQVKGRGKKGSELGYMGYAGTEDFEALDSPMSTDGGDNHQMNGLSSEGMDGVGISI